MTTLVAWVQPDLQRAFWAADSGAFFSKQQVDKTRLISRRWAIAVYGSSLLLSVLDPIGYFNDKSDPTVIADVADFLEQLRSSAAIVLPRKLEWLRKSNLDPIHCRAIEETSSGYLIMDCQAYKLFLVHANRVLDFISLNSNMINELAGETVWQVGFPQRARPPVVSCHADCTMEGSLNVLQTLHAQFPDVVGERWARIIVHNGQIDYRGPWDTVESAARDAVAGTPHYIYD